MDLLYDIRELFKDYFDFEFKGLFSKEVSLDYKGISEQPWLFFNCLSNDNFSFRVHDLEFGEKEAMFWHLATQRNKKIKFDGFVNRLIKDLRGYLIIPDDYHKLGIRVSSGRVYKIRTQEEIDDSREELRDKLYTCVILPILHKEEIVDKVESYLQKEELEDKVES